MKRSWFENNDIPSNILSRLPTKRLNHLKYVSKDWHNLISDLLFIKSQLKNMEPVSGFFFQEMYQCVNDNNESIIYIPVEMIKIWHTVLNFLPEKFFVLSSNNGLLCCRSILPNSLVLIYICNPLNKQWTSVEWPDLQVRSSIALAFDPIRDSMDVSTDFKQVAVSKGDQEREPSKTGSWAR